MAVVLRQQDLEYVMRQVFKAEYAELKARRFVPPSMEMPPVGARSFTFRTYDIHGIAQIISSYANDLPSVDISAIEDTSKIVDIGNQWEWSLQEIEACQLAGINLPDARAIAARQIMDNTIDKMIAFGDSASGVPGFLNNDNVPQGSVETVGSDTTWADKADTDPELMVDDVNDAIAEMIDLTKERETPDTVLLPTAQFQLLKRSRIQDQNMFALELVQKANPGILIDSWNYLAGAGESDTDRMVIYKRSSAKLGYIVPREFTPTEPQRFNFAWKVPCIATCGGTVIAKPLSVSYKDGI